MVRKIVVVVASCVMLVAIATTYAGAVTPYDGTISSTYIDIFKQFDISINDDYVFFRSGQYEYSMLVGDIDYSNNNFNLSGNGKLYTLVYNTGTGYGSNSYYTRTVSDVSNYTVTTGGKLVYSNLGDFPILGERGDIYAFISAFLLSVIGLSAFIGGIFGFVLRYRGTSTRGNDN